MVSKQILSGRNRTSDPVIADIYSHMLYQLSYAESQRAPGGGSTALPPGTGTHNKDVCVEMGLSRESNPGPLAPEARIMPLDH